MYAKHIVSTKLALYSYDLKSVLLMQYPVRGVYGLPGGHVERKETPDEAIKRELQEELTLTIATLKRADFFLRGSDHGPIILAFSAVAPIDVAIKPTKPSFEYGVWVSKEAVTTVDMSQEYKRFIIENWPKQ